MFKTSHLQELVRRYSSMYAPEPVEESDTKEDHVKHECPKCKGEGCEHCDGKGYHVEDEDEDPVGKNEEVELDEMKWEAGVVYHQEFKNGDRVYFRADSVQKNKRWKGLSVDEFGGRQKKAKNASADEKQQGWETTPKNEIPKGLKEEVEIEEEVSAKEFDALKKGDTVTIEFKSPMSTGKSTFKVTAKNVVGKARIEKVTLQNVKRPNTVKFFLYKRGNKVSLAQGDMAASVVSFAKEEVELDESLALQLKMAFDDANIKMKSKSGKIVIAKKDQKKAMDVLTKTLPSKLKRYVDKAVDNFLVFEEVEIDEMPNRANMEKINSLLKKYSGKFKWRDEELYVEKGIEKDVANRIKIAGLNMPTIKVSSNPMREEVEVDEAEKLSSRGKATLKKSGYELYHKTFSDAMQHAYAHAKKKGVIVDPKEIDDKVATGPKKPSSGKTNRYILGTNTKKKVHIQVANLDNKRYELNMYIESNVTLGEIKKVLSEAPSPNQAAIDAFLKKGGKIKKYTPDLKKRKKDVDSFRKSFANTVQKQKDADKKATRRYVSGGGKRDNSTSYNTSDYITHKDINKFPRSLASGLQKIISGAKMQKHEIKHTTYGKIPGMGITFPGSIAPKLMIQFDERIKDPNIGKIGADPEYAEKGTDPTIYRKFQMTVWINEAATAKDRKSDRVDWFQRKEFEGKTADEVAKRTLQYLKTKVKRMANEELVVEREMTAAEKDKREEIVLSLKKKTKDFKERYGDKWKEVMYATATKMAMGEEKDKKESSSKKDKINLKPTMDETMKKYKDLLKGLKEKKSTKEDTNPDKEGTQGDKEEYAKKRDAVLKKFGVKSCAACETEEEKKACYKALDDAHVADHEEETKKEQVEVDARKKGYKEAMKRIEARRSRVSEKEKKKKDWYMDDPQEGPAKPKGVKEAVTLGGVEYGEQDFDHGARLAHAAPNLEINMRMAEFTEQGLEGPYLWKGETYFFDRKINGWYSLSSEDYVDDAMNAELGLAYTRDGGYKKQFAS